jgi:hypothetical protein
MIVRAWNPLEQLHALGQSVWLEAAYREHGQPAARGGAA